MTSAYQTSRRTLLIGMTATLTASCARAAQAAEITVHKTPWCGCCEGWVTHLQQSGFKTQVVETQDLAPLRTQYGIPFEISSCHTGIAQGYFFEGHVPAADVKRVLSERPKGIGITVPGMPFGSPGMEMPNGDTEAFDTLLVLDRTGRTRVFAHHAAAAS